jgi:hypothetical protein
MRICDSQLFLSCRCSGLAGADPNSLFQVSNEYRSVADPARTGRVRDRFENRLGDAVVDSDLELGPGSELRFMHFGDRHALHTELCNRVSQFVQLERPDDSGDHFHDVHFAKNSPVKRRCRIPSGTLESQADRHPDR